LSIRVASAIEADVRAIARCLTAAITIAAWIAISNHCAFAAVAPNPESVQSECPFHSKPAKSKVPPVAVQCCKILRATTTAPAKTPARAIVDLPRIDLALAQPIVSLPAKISFASICLDTGPPGTTSFVELIGSVQAHAPPFRA
jgi:hypothetical protein